MLQVPVAHGKADLTIYRDAGAAVINVLSKSAVCERASIDEAYLDVTAAAQQLLADAKKRGSRDKHKRHVDGTPAANHNTTADGTPEAAAAATGEACGGVAEADSESNPEDGAECGGAGDAELVLQLPAPESFEGWHVAGVVSCTLSRITVCTRCSVLDSVHRVVLWATLPSQLVCVQPGDSHAEKFILQVHVEQVRLCCLLLGCACMLVVACALWRHGRSPKAPK
jgi:hypothetical protein